jgi:anti-anti-sigma regulatory factor
MSFSIVALPSGVTRISLEGDLAVSAVEGLRPELGSVARRRPTHVEMELSDLQSISPRGVSVLLSFVASVARAGCRITVTGLRDQPLDAFKSTLAGAILNAAPPAN